MLRWAYCFVFIWYTHIASTYEAQFFTFMKDSLSLHVSNIHKYFRDKGIFVGAASLLLIACDPGDPKLKFILLLISLEVVFWL